MVIVISSGSRENELMVHETRTKKPYEKRSVAIKVGIDRGRPVNRVIIGVEQN
jgi:hypothetical protein